MRLADIFKDKSIKKIDARAMIILVNVKPPVLLVIWLLNIHRRFRIVYLRY